MKVKSIAEIKSLDEDLHLFDEDEWDFFGGGATDSLKGENFEYFNDIEDVDFVYDARKSVRATIAIATVIGVGIIGLGAWLVHDINVRNQTYLEQLQAAPTIAYHEGVEGDSESLIEASRTLSGYFSTLSQRHGMSGLAAYCENSKLEKEYEEALETMQTSFDEGDCYARLLAKFASLIRLNRIDKVILDKDTYYVYCDLSVPTQADLYDYLHVYGYSFAKHFTSNQITTGEVGKYLVETLDSGTVSCTSGIYCIQMDKDFRIIDDSEIKGVCADDYAYAVSETVQIVENQTLKN